MKMYRALLTLVPIALLTAGCAATKSSDPLSPTIAGPIPGVNITAPNPVDPNIGTQVAVDKQPVTLTVENSTTNSPRPLNYLFEVATDTQFTNKVFSRDGVPPGDGGRTGLRLPSPLTTGRTYYWHVRAQDGANTGPYSSAAYFTVFTPVVLGAPTLVDPINNATVSGTTPTFVIGNAPRSGPVGAITYTIEVAEDGGFANRVAVWAIAEQPNQTSLPSPQSLAYGKQFFWHARAQDGGTPGPWSSPQSFQTPAAPAPPPPSGGGGGGGGRHIIVPDGWQNCGSTPGVDLVACVRAFVNPTDTETAFEVSKRVAWQLRAKGGGLMIKNGGENVTSWQGYNFSASRIEFSDCSYVKIISDAGPGGANGASWQPSPDPADCNQFVAAMDPNLP
jgi:hypothetical protein